MPPQSNFQCFIHFTFCVYTLPVRKCSCCVRRRRVFLILFGFFKREFMQQCMKLTRPLNQWRHRRGTATPAAWSRLLEISILHLKVALPQCCVSVSSLMLLIKKIPRWSKQWFPHQVSVRCILLTYMCHFLFYATCVTHQEHHHWYIMQTACHTS